MPLMPPQSRKATFSQTLTEREKSEARLRGDSERPQLRRADEHCPGLGSAVRRTQELWDQGPPG